MLAAGLILLVVGAALVLRAPTESAPSREITLLDVEPDQGLAKVDADNDHLSDLEEAIAGTNPQANDTDSDHLPDSWEVRNAKFDGLSKTYCPDPLRADAETDCDGDGLDNREEMDAGTDPNNPDIDHDTIPDGKEVACGSDPFTPDAEKDPDGDGLTNQEEMALGTRCDRKDTDLDGLEDPEELDLTKTDPTRASTGGSGIADGWLVAWKLPLDNAALGFQDPDGDGLTTLEEYQFAVRLAKEQGNRSGSELQGQELRGVFARALDPFDQDTDGDAMDDGYEVQFRLDPLDPGTADHERGPDGDPDHDSLLNRFEAQAGSDPFQQDSDADQLSDFDEVTKGWVVKVGDKVTNVTSDPSRADSDGDGLTDFEERQGKATREGVERTFPALDPRSPDTDLDGLGDLEEVTLPVVSPQEPRRLDPTNPDTDGDGLLDGAEFRFWNARAADTGPDVEEALGRLATQMGQASGATVSREDARNALRPGGDLDGDGRPNLLDRDSDEDTIDDGKEVVPEEKATSEDSHLRRTLPATDPALVDTDGEGLPDAWENRYATYDFALGDWNLNASRKDSLRLSDGKTDADRDLDNDGVHFNGTGYAHRVSYDHSNVQEFLAGTHPNLLDTDQDGLSDGWEHYFSCVTAKAPRHGCGSLLPQGQVDRVVDLDPTLDDTDHNGIRDADESAGKVAYVRFLQADAPLPPGTLDPDREETSEDCANTGPGDAACDLFPGQGVVRIHGFDELNMSAAFERGLDPSLRDTDADRMDDAWELAQALNPLNPGDAEGDVDADQLTNQEEFAAGTDPRLADTDIGSLADNQDPNPLYPPDDEPNGDTDCDGVKNADESGRGSSLADFDSDHDGLLDGPGIAFYATTQSNVKRAADVVTSEGCSQTVDELLAAFRERVIAQNRTGSGGRDVLFLGEDMFKTKAGDGDSDADGIPDGWEAYWVDFHGNPQGARDPLEPGFRDDGDALNNSAEYRAGMPEGWGAQGCGVWWMGSDPRSPDSDADGVADGAVVDGQAVGQDFDLDNDGLDDFLGVDPVALYDPTNTQAGALGACGSYADVVESWVFQGGRRASAGRDTDRDGVGDAGEYAKTRITDLTFDLDPDHLLGPTSQGDVLAKGGRFVARGRVLVAETTASQDQPVAGMAVVVNLADSANGRSGARGDVLGVGITGPDGRFEVQGAVTKEREATLSQQVVVFGRAWPAGATLSWEPDTSKLAPRSGYRVVVWAAPRQESPTGPYDFEATTPGGATFHARGAALSVATSDLVTLQSSSTMHLPPGLAVTAGQQLEAAGEVVDSLGDPLPKTFLEGGVLRATWLGTTYGGPPTVTVREGGFDLVLRADLDTALGPHNLTVVYDGFGLVAGSTLSRAVNVRYATSIEGHVLNQGLVAVAGEPLEVEGQVRDFKGNALPAGLGVEVRLQGSSFPGNTTQGGAFHILATVPESVAPGTQAVEVAFPGSDTYEASTAEAGFVTLVQKTKLVIQAGRSPLGKDLLILGKLEDLGGQPVDDPTEDNATRVRVRTPVNEGFANVTDTQFTFPVPRDLLPGAGPFRVRAEFAGSRFYRGSVDTRDVLLTSRTTLVLDAGVIVRGLADQKVTGRLLDEKDRGVAGEVVVVKAANRTGNAVTDANGTYAFPILLPADYPLGGIVGLATYGGGRDGLLERAPDAQAALRVVAATTLTVEGRSQALGPVQVSGSLRDDRDKPVPGAKLQVLLDNVTLGFAVSDLQGSFETELALPGGVEPGAHELRVRFGGSGTLAGAEVAVTYHLLTPVDVTLLRSDALVRGGNAVVEALLAETSGLPLRERVLEARIDGTPVGQGRTDEHGHARIAIKPPNFLAPGNVTLEVRFAGDASHMDARDAIELPLTVRTDLSIDAPAVVDRDAVFAGTIVVRDDAGRPVAGQRVVLSFTGFQVPVTLTTDAGGKANFSARMAQAGTGEMHASFAGAPGLAGADASLVVESRAPLLERPATLGILAVALALVVVGAVLLARALRRGQVREVERILVEAERRLVASSEYQASILWAYRRLVDHAREEGFLVKESVTPRELVDALAQELAVARGPLERLVGVFEEARYSGHEVGPRQRDVALAALRAIEADLRANQGVRKAPEGGVTDG